MDRQFEYKVTIALSGNPAEGSGRYHGYVGGTLQDIDCDTCSLDGFLRIVVKTIFGVEGYEIIGEINRYIMFGLPRFS